MSPVDFKKWQFPLSLFLTFSCRFKNSPMSPDGLKKCQCLLSIFFSNVHVQFKVVQCCLSNLRKPCVALSNLRVKGPYLILFRNTGPKAKSGLTKSVGPDTSPSI